MNDQSAEIARLSAENAALRADTDKWAQDEIARLCAELAEWKQVERRLRPVRGFQSHWVPREEWAAHTVIIIGTGPSLSLDQVHAISRARARGRVRVIAINDAVFCSWFADIAFAGDRDWWIARNGLHAFPGRKVCLAESFYDAAELMPEMLLLRRSGSNGCDLTPGYVCTHGNSGAMAVQLAAQMGAPLIGLVGFDMKTDGDGRRHFFGAYEGALKRAPDMATWADWFREIADRLGGRLVNATPGSAADYVRAVELDEVLQ